MTTITVTAEHIRKGKRSNCERCPIALALIASIPGAAFAEVWFRDEDEMDARATVWLDEQTRTLNFGLAVESAAFINDFDEGHDVEPFSFTVDYPEAAS